MCQCRKINEWFPYESETDALYAYNEWLDEAYDTVSVMGLDYAPSDALRRLDETAYREGLLNHVNNHANEAESLKWHDHCPEEEARVELHDALDDFVDEGDYPGFEVTVAESVVPGLGTFKLSWTPVKPEPRVFTQCDLIPATVTKIVTQQSPHVATRTRSGGWSYASEHGDAAGWPLSPADFPVTEVVE